MAATTVVAIDVPPSRPDGTVAGGAAAAKQPVVRKGPVSHHPSLLNPDTDEEDSSDEFSDVEPEAQPSLLPIDDLIARVPKSFQALLKLLLPRLSPRPEEKGVSSQDQQSIVSILVGELANQFSVIQHQIDDPFLNNQKNKELHRRIIVRVCMIIEELFAECIAKIAALNSEDVFSVSANTSRLRAQLALQINKSLDIPYIRRQVLDELRDPVRSKLPPVSRLKKRRAKAKQTLGDIKLDEPLSKKAENLGIAVHTGWMNQRIKKLEARMPKSTHSRKGSTGAHFDDVGAEVEGQEGYAVMGGDSADEDGFHWTTSPNLLRVPSLPELTEDFLLLDLGLDPGIPSTAIKGEIKEERRNKFLGIQRRRSMESISDLKLSAMNVAVERMARVGTCTQQDMAEDLEELFDLWPSNTAKISESGDLHPLLQAHTHSLSTKKAQRLAVHNARLQAHAQMQAHSRDALCRREEESFPRKHYMRTVGEASVGWSGDEETQGKAHSHYWRATDAVSSDDKQVTTLLAPNKDNSSSDDIRYTTTPTHAPHASLGGKNDNDGDIDNNGDNNNNIAVRCGGDIQVATPPAPRDSGAGDVVTVHVTGAGEAQHSTSTASSESCSQLLASIAQHHQSTKHQKQLQQQQQQQPTVITSRMNQQTVRTTDVRVSEQNPLHSLRLKPFPPVYNELTEELDDSMLEELDYTLNEGKEIRDVYKEVKKDLSTKHLEYESEPTLEPSLTHPVNLSRSLASNTLHHRKRRRVINPALRHQDSKPPWTESGLRRTREEWEQCHLYHEPSTEELERKKTANSKGLPRAYKSWLNWWKGTITYEDYLMFVSREESDYLRLVYHLYDSEGSDSEDEEERKGKRDALAALQEKLLAKEKQRSAMRAMKQQYEPGLWNVGTVTMGGLGGEPGVSEDSEEDEEKPVDIEEDKKPQTPVQDRLQVIWTRLKFPQSQRIDMAIKYSGAQCSDHIDKALKWWEKACEQVEQREGLLGVLQAFEQQASDPSRYFVKEHQSSSVKRLEEARKRDKLHRELNSKDSELSQTVRKILKEFGDTVTYNGRPYREKMSLDRTEMLYWLQQERRKLLLRPVITSLDSMAIQPPISMQAQANLNMHS